jgi:hypothetical protein
MDYGWMDRRMAESMDGGKDGWMDWRMDGWKERRMNGRMVDRRMMGGWT